MSAQRMLQQPQQQLSGVPISGTPSGLNPQNMTQGEMEQLLHLLGRYIKLQSLLVSAKSAAMMPLSRGPWQQKIQVK